MLLYSHKRPGFQPTKARSNMIFSVAKNTNNVQDGHDDHDLFQEGIPTDRLLLHSSWEASVGTTCCSSRKSRGHRISKTKGERKDIQTQAISIGKIQTTTIAAAAVYLSLDATRLDCLSCPLPKSTFCLHRSFPHQASKRDE